MALKQFGHKVQQAGLLSEARRRQQYESPQARRKAAAQLRKRARFSHVFPQTREAALPKGVSGGSSPGTPFSSSRGRQV